MRCCSLLCVALCVVFASSRALHAVGIEAAAIAENLIESCQNKNLAFSSGCVNYNLNHKWKNELQYAGKRFSAIGQFDQIKKSLLGNLFAFVTVGQYKVARKITQRYAENLTNTNNKMKVLIDGVLDSYKLSFNLHRFHHLRLAPYYSIEVVA